MFTPLGFSSFEVLGLNKAKRVELDGTQTPACRSEGAQAQIAAWQSRDSICFSKPIPWALDLDERAIGCCWKPRQSACFSEAEPMSNQDFPTQSRFFNRALMI